MLYSAMQCSCNRLAVVHRTEVRDISMNSTVPGTACRRSVKSEMNELLSAYWRKSPLSAHRAAPDSSCHHFLTLLLLSISPGND